MMIMNLPWKNVPNTEETSERATYEAWGHTGICYRRRVGCDNTKAKINSDRATAEEQRHMNRGSWFLPFFPIAYIWDVVQYVNNELRDHDKITYGELIRYMGIRFLIATVDGHSKKSFWMLTNILAAINTNQSSNFGKRWQRI